MSPSFPTDLLTYVHCPRDDGRLVGEAESPRIRDGFVRCSTCGTRYPVVSGILDLLGTTPLIEAESRFELVVREAEASNSRGHPSFQVSWQDETELDMTMRAFGPLRGRTVLELGSGPGFVTRALVGAGARVVGVDFSHEALRVNAAQLTDGDDVLLVRADVGRVRFAADSFDMATSTLYSNLPTTGLRYLANAAVARALKPGADYWVGAHQQHLRRLIAREPAADHYKGSGIFFQNFTPRTLRRELSPHFARVRIRGMSVWIPVVSNIRAVRAFLSNALGAIPGLRRAGFLLLARATKTG